MDKKTTKPEPKIYTEADVQTALDVISSEFFMQSIAVASYDPKQEELTFIKRSVITPDGGTYLISILHVDGPKVNLKKLGQIADQAEADKTS